MTKLKLLHRIFQNYFKPTYLNKLTCSIYFLGIELQNCIKREVKCFFSDLYLTFLDFRTC